jgi:UDPglucose 6-dehydrogenase
MDEARRVFALDFADQPDALSRISYVDEPRKALIGADALVIVTEWKAFKSPDFAYVKAQLKTPVIFDGRNLYDPATVAEQGIEYFGIGRSETTSSREGVFNVVA